MRIASVRIKNFRGVLDQTVELGEYTCLLGANGAGKSTVLSALNVFFQNAADSSTNVSKLSEEDFHRRNTAEPIAITITFEDLSDAAKAELSDYVRLDKLVVTALAEWNPASGSAEVTQHGQRAVMEEFKDYFGKEKAGVLVGDLRARYRELREQYSDLPDVITKGEMAEGLRAYERARPEACTLVSSPDQFYGIGGKGRLMTHVQWVYVPAVKDSASEQSEGPKSALALLLKRAADAKTATKEQIASLRVSTQERYGEILAENASGLDSLTESLSLRIREWAHADAALTVRWRKDVAAAVSLNEPVAEITAGDGDFEGQLSRFGHGLQRSFLIAILQELAAAETDDAPSLILGCEEPEIYQHPPQAKHLAAVFQRLAAGNAQVVLCTHSPYFVQGRSFEDVRVLRRRPGAHDVIVASATFEDVASRIAAATGKPLVKSTGMRAKLESSLRPERAEVFFAQSIVIVEGVEDAAYLMSELVMAGKWEEVRALGVHIVPMGGKSEMPQPIAALQALGVPTYVVCDSDFGCEAKHEATQRAQNGVLQGLCGVGKGDTLPAATVWSNDFVMCSPNLPAVVQGEIGVEEWRAAAERVRGEHGLDVGGMEKNALFVGLVLDELAPKKLGSPTLQRIAKEIVEFGERSRSGIDPVASPRAQEVGAAALAIHGISENEGTIGGT